MVGQIIYFSFFKIYFHFFKFSVSALINHYLVYCTFLLSSLHVYVLLHLLSIFSRIRSSSCVILFIILPFMFSSWFPRCPLKSLNTIVAFCCISLSSSIYPISSIIFLLWFFVSLSFPVFIYTSTVMSHSLEGFKFHSFLKVTNLKTRWD